MEIIFFQAWPIYLTYSTVFIPYVGAIKYIDEAIQFKKSYKPMEKN